MTNQILKEKYSTIESKRAPLAKRYKFLKENKGDKEEIKKIGTELTKLTLNQVHILINLELEE